MMGRSLERRFLRFRRKGDPSALAWVFDRTAPEILRVAMHFARDPGEAEDLLQRTFLTAIERAASFDAGERLVPWLLGILANHAREAARRDRRTVDPERLLRPRIADPAASAQSAEGVQEAQKAIDALPDPYRSVLVLRFRHGMEPAEIANALGLPPATVRSHLHRGLERVKRTVPSGLASAAFADLPVMRGLSSVRATVLLRAEAVAPEIAASAAATAALAAGGLLVTKKAIVVAALLLLFGGGTSLWWANRVSKDDLPAPAPIPPEVSRAVPGLAPASVPPPTPLTGEAVAASAPRSATDRVLDVRVLWPEGSPAAGIGLTAIPGGRDDPTAFARGETDEAGGFRFAGLPPGQVLVRTDRGVGKYVDVPDGGAGRLEIRIASGVRIEGEVVDADGAPVPGASVWLLGGVARWMACRAATCDEKGRFTLRDVEPGRPLWARATDRSPSAVVRHWVGKAGETTQMRLRLGGPSGVIAGRVLAPDGKPIAGASVQVGYDFGRPTPLEDGTQGEEPAPILATAEADGAFRIEGVAPGATFVAARARGWSAAARMTLTVEAAPTTTSLTLRLAAAAVLLGTARDESGAALSGASVEIGRWTDFLHWQATSAVDGSYRVEGVPCDPPIEGADPRAAAAFGPQRVQVEATHANGGRASASVVVKPGEESRWDPVLAAGKALRVRVLDEEDQPVEGIVVYAGWMSSLGQGQGKTDRTGRTTIGRLSQPSYELRAFGDSGYAFAFLGNAKPGPEEVVWRIRRADIPSARVVGAVVGPDEKVPPGIAFVPMSASAGQGMFQAVDPATGRFASELLPPGEYDLTVQAPGFGTVPLGRRRLSAGETVDLGRIRLRESGAVTIRLVYADGSLHLGTSVRLDGGLGYLFAMDAEGFGVARIPKVPPGRYYVVACHPDGYGAVAGEVAVEEGREATVALTLPKGREVRLAFRPPPGSSFPEGWSADVRAEGDEAVLYPLRACPAWLGTQEDHRVWVAPGRYRVRFASDDGWKADQRFEVRESDPKDAVVAIPLSK